MKFKHHFLDKTKVILSALLLLPLASYAHLIAITATKPFPKSVMATSTSSATFKITNITSKANVTVIDQSTFPKESGLSISSSTCGRLLKPSQSCVIQLKLEAPSTGKAINTALKEWAKPTADGVQYPINITVKGAPTLPEITLVPVSNALPAFRDPVLAQLNNEWLIVSGSIGNFHDFNKDFNTDIYVFNPVTKVIHSVAIANTDLDAGIKQQLATSSTESLQDGNTLYIIGGFNTTDNINWTTLQRITSFDVPGMIQAVKNGDTNLNQYTHTRNNITQFKVTGGQLGKINGSFYLAYGQDCEGGSYCEGGQAYTNSIYQFTNDPTLNVTITNTITHSNLDGSGWRRRDYTLTPLMIGATESLFAMAGPFTPSNNALVWTNGITFDENINSNDTFINQQANQYASPSLSMHSTSKNLSYVATFGGLSNLYWAANGLIYDNTTPYGNILDLITTDGFGAVQEYANFKPLCSGQPLASCLYMGLGAKFIPVASYYDNRAILQLDQLPQQGKTLVGYVYAGIVSTDQAIFALPPPPNPPNPPSPSYATNQIYAVYVAPSIAGANNWKNITNLYPGN